MKLACPCQFATGVKVSFPSLPCSISSFASTAVPSSASSPCPAAGSVITCTFFRLSFASGSLNAPSKSAAVNVSAVSSAVLTFSAAAVGASFAPPTVIVAVAVADAASVWSTTWNVNVAFPA